jgi:hypothetical protein
MPTLRVKRMSSSVHIRRQRARHLQWTTEIFTRMGYLVYQAGAPTQAPSGGSLNSGNAPGRCPVRPRQAGITVLYDDFLALREVASAGWPRLAVLRERAPRVSWPWWG